jgi:hypothetical protein
MAVFVDRFPLRPMMIGACVVRDSALVSLPFAFALHDATLRQFLVVRFVVGLASVVFDSAHVAFSPCSSRANTSLKATQNVDGLVGCGSRRHEPGGYDLHDAPAAGVVRADFRGQPADDSPHAVAAGTARAR